MMHENSEPNFGLYHSGCALWNWGPGDKVEPLIIAGKYRVLRHTRCSLWCSIYHFLTRHSIPGGITRG